MVKLDPPFVAVALGPDAGEVLRDHLAAFAKLPSAAEPLCFTWEAAEQVRVRETTREPTSAPLELPPGNAGHLARWLLDAAMLPVPEVAVVTTLGILAGLCGRAWVTPAPCTGLNIYLILIARSATGKEALHEGANRILTALRRRVPSASQLINFDDYASGPTLAKQCAVEPRSFVNFSTEFGRRIRRMANPKDAPMGELRTVLTKLYAKSGPASIVGNLMYSKERYDNQGSVACSLVGETTPGTLRAAMTQDMMEDGFLSRFGWIEYTGDRPAENMHAAIHVEPPEALVEGLANIAARAMTLFANSATQEVGCAPEATILLSRFSERCNTAIKSAADNEAHRQVWSRAALKAKKYASLLAVADNHVCPTITAAHVTWCVNVVERDAAIFESSLASGDVGSDTVAQERKLLHVLREYLRQPLRASYGVPAQMQKDGVVPRRFLQMRTSDTAAFRSHPLGATAALDHALRSLCDSGYLAEIDKVKASELYTFQGRCFRIVDLPRSQHAK